MANDEEALELTLAVMVVLLLVATFLFWMVWQYMLHGLDFEVREFRGYASMGKPSIR